ncbi:hypothetical protein SAMN05444159_2673 [Bradyrhizobium lablabi]|uniref:HNH nuclease domain-containing protein n=1 Tax=Bradyrhizobium lablabi TaxID=722472 RepID=A0A1M6QH31_9BRAD|nr:hypothetical protein [Bradyrhizobium lablabi]SHK19614.1 hypothetical protein SAMN05444159_2673 [Bradyrhizobium lablabi]
MKLTDFYKFAPLNDLRARMGIPSDVYGTLTITISAAKLTPDELDRLYEGDGLEVGFDEINIHDDGTLIYKNARVLLYIRDVHQYQEQVSLPKYHLAHCPVLKNMSEIGRSHRYLISARVDGIFRLNVFRGDRMKTQNQTLNVCQHCLSTLEFNGFKNNLTRPERTLHVNAFTPANFFEQYPRLLDGTGYGGGDVTPINAYPADFARISTLVRTVAGWRCQEATCKYDCSSPALRQYLHVHHLNGNRADSGRKNLKAVCVECHAKQPKHSHVKNTPQYQAFMRIRYGR